MRNFVEPGQFGVPVITPNAVTSGQLVIIGAIVGVAATDAAAGATVSLAMEGVYDLAKVPADALVVGAVTKIITASGLVGATGTAVIGWVVQAATAGSATARVRLTPAVSGTPTVLAEHETPAHDPHAKRGAA